MKINARSLPAALGLLLVAAAAMPALAAAEPGATARPAAAIPVALPLDVYGDLPGVEDVALSPDGKGLAILGRVGDKRLLLVIRDGKLVTKADAGDAKIRSIGWAGNATVLLVSSSTVDLGPDFLAAKHEFYGVLIVRLDGTPPEQVFAKSAKLMRATFGDYGIREIDGKLTGYFGGIELVRNPGAMSGYRFDHGRPALFSVDLARNAPRNISRAAFEGHRRDWLVDARGQVAATLDVEETNGKWSIVNAQGTALAAGIDPQGDVSLVGLGRDGMTVLYATEDDAAEVRRWREVPLAGGEAKDVFADVSIARTYFDPATGHLLGYLPDGEGAQPVLFAPEHQAALRKVYRAFPKLDVSIGGWTPDFGYVLVRTRGNLDSGTWYTVDMAKLTASAVGYERPAIDPGRVGPISTFAYKAGDGLDLDGVLTLPPGREAKNLPVVMLPHGGPHAEDKATFDWWAQAFASRGYAVFQPNFRGSTNRDTAFVRAGYGQWGRKMQTDISDGLAALARQGIVDPKRACIVGASYGGYAALAGVTLQQGLYRCAVAVAPVSDLTEMYRTDYRESGDNKMLELGLRESLGDPKTFAEVSPRRNAARADAPVLLVHGKDDTVVPFHQSEAMADALRNAGKPYEMVVLREEDHWLSRAATRKQMLEAVMSFVQRSNPAD